VDILLAVLSLVFVTLGVFTIVFLFATIDR
jgi:hypothetical protein